MAGVLSLRFVELFAFFAIVFVSRLLAGFQYRAEAMLVVFLGAAFLHFIAEMLWQWVGDRRHWSADRVRAAVEWYASYVDILLVLSLVYLTGSIESPFLLLLAVPLFFAGNTFPWRTTMKGFVPPAILGLTLLAVLELYGVIPHQNCYSWFEADIYRNAHYVAGTILVVGAFIGLVLFLSNAFQVRIHNSVDRLRRRDEEKESRITELTHLYDISNGINAAISVDTLLRIVAKEATRLLHLPWASIVLFNERQEITHSVFVGVNQGQEVKLEKRIRRGGLSEWIWTHNAPIVVNNTKKDKRANCSELLSKFGILSVAGMPLTTGNQVIGVIYTGGFSTQEFSDDKFRLLTSLSDQLSTALEKSRMHEMMERRIRSLEKQIKSLEAANMIKTDFVNHVSHELRTPLTSIKAYVETLGTHIEDPGFKEKGEFLDIVSKETDRLIRIVNEILDVTRIEFGQRPLDRSVFDIRSIIADVVSMLAPTLKERRVDVRVEINETMPEIDADPDLIKQVFINLISNAVKYSPEGSTVTVRAVEQAVDLVISIEDQGMGIPEDELENVFDKYFRVRGEGLKLEGVGLGLAIVKNIVEQHGGTVSVESEEGVGSKFTFKLPREHCTNDLAGYIAEIVDAKEHLHEMLELIIKMIAELLKTRRASLMLLDESQSELFIKIAFGIDEWIVENTRVKIGEGIAGRVAETGKPILIKNIEENDIYAVPNQPQYETESLLSAPLIVNDVVVGVINVNNKTSGEPFNQDDLNLLVSFSQRISKALERIRAVEDSSAFLGDTTSAFKRMVEDPLQTKFIESVVRLAVKVSRKLGLPEKDVSVVQYVASVHDIGMTEISHEILEKALSLTTEEVKRIREHPQRGAELIRPLEFVEAVSNIILYHHERVDGSGYPMGLKGDAIPVGARILSVIDAFLSMTTRKIYKEQRGLEEAALELVACSGTQFDSKVVDAFLIVLNQEGRLSTDRLRMLRDRLRGAVDQGVGT